MLWSDCLCVPTVWPCRPFGPGFPGTPTSPRSPAAPCWTNGQKQRHFFTLFICAYKKEEIYNYTKQVGLKKKPIEAYY